MDFYFKYDPDFFNAINYGGQNQYVKYSESPDEADFKVNTKDRIEIERIIKHLEAQDE